MTSTDTIPAEFECPPYRGHDTYVRVQGSETIHPEDRFAYNADCAIYHAPDDLSTLDETTFGLLGYQHNSRWQRLRHAGRKCETTEFFERRLCDEIKRRKQAGKA
jgi:hypothetical protein